MVTMTVTMTVEITVTMKLTAVVIVGKKFTVIVGMIITMA